MLVLVRWNSGKFDKYWDIESIRLTPGLYQLWRTNQLVVSLPRTSVTLEVQ